MASTYLSKTFSAGNRKTWTWSGWVKRTGFDASNNMVLFGSYQDGSNQLKLQIANTNQIQTYGLSGGTLVCRVLTNALYRDVNSWYHIVYSLDTTQATSTDRQKVWVNGEEVTSFSTRTDPSQNADLEVNDTNSHTIGQMNSGDYFNGVLAHVHFIDGTRYDASYFGETDATTGIWKPKTAPSVTYGTNGFFLKFENSGSMGTDSSGNANNFTVNGTLTQTVDTPSNVFATLNGLIRNATGSTLTLSNGNLQSYSASTSYFAGFSSTLGISSGKYYWEYKLVSTTAGLFYTGIGVTSENYVNYISSASRGDPMAGGTS